MALGDVIRTFAAPGVLVQDLAFDGKDLWHTDLVNIYQIDRLTGTVKFSFALGDIYGLTFDGNSLWGSTITPTNLIYQIDRITGAIIRSFPTPDNYISGLAFDGKHLWLANQDIAGDPRLIYQVDPFTGAVLRSFASPSSVSSGLTFDGKSLWHVDYSLNMLWEIDRVTGAVINSVVLGDQPKGITFDGKYVWIAYRTDLTIRQVSLN